MMMTTGGGGLVETLASYISFLPSEIVKEEQRTFHHFNDDRDSRAVIATWVIFASLRNLTVFC